MSLGLDALLPALGTLDALVEAYATLDAGTQILSADDALAAFADADVPTSLPRTAAKINPFLVDSGLTKSEAPIENLFDPSFTQAVVDGGS